MHKYDVQYQLNGEIDWKRIEATDPGNAFAKAEMMFPDATIVKAVQIGSAFGVTWSTEYQSPPVRREIKPPPKPFNPKKAAANTLTFPFYDEVKKNERACKWERRPRRRPLPRFN